MLEEAQKNHFALLLELFYNSVRAKFPSYRNGYIDMCKSIDWIYRVATLTVNGLNAQ